MRRARPLAGMLIVVIAAAGSIVLSYLLWTPIGAALVLRRALALTGPVRDLEVGAMRGGLLQGCSVQGLRWTMPRGPAPGSRVSIEQAALTPAGGLLARRWRLALQRVRLSAPDGSLELAADSVQATLGRDWSAHDVQGSGAWLPPGGVVRLQRLEGVFPVQRWSAIRALQNGRLLLAGSEPVVFYGMQRDGEVTGRAYVRTLQVSDLAALLPQARVRMLNGVLTDVHVRLVGTPGAPTVSGSFRIDHLIHSRLLAKDGSGAFALEGRRTPAGWKLEGMVRVKQGSLTSPTASGTLHQAELLFTGDPRRPTVEVEATSVIQQVRVNISIRGTLDNPHVALTSSPPMSQDRLLVMLLTGKSWASAETMLREGALSPDLARDFIDYFVFGGRAGRLARRFGVSDVSFTYDPVTKEVGAKTLFFDRVETSYELEPPPADDPTHEIPATQRLGAGYHLDEDRSIHIEAEKELTRRGEPATPEAPASADEETPRSTDSTIFDRVLMIFRNRF